MHSRLLIKPARFNGQPGFALKVLDPQITVQQFLDELNHSYLHDNWPRLWPVNRADCEGCDLCCREPLPVTSIDVMQIGKALGIPQLEVFRYLWVEVQGAVVDITLRRRGQKCIFLKSRGKCSIYARRPFACQTYLCCQTSPEFEQLRSEIVNKGMDELVRCSLAAFNQAGRPLPVNRSFNARIDPRDWRKGHFTGKNSYQQLKLGKLLSFDLWRKMLLLK